MSIIKLNIDSYCSSAYFNAPILVLPFRIISSPICNGFGKIALITPELNGFMVLVIKTRDNSKLKKNCCSENFNKNV